MVPRYQNKLNPSLTFNMEVIMKEECNNCTYSFYYMTKVICQRYPKLVIKGPDNWCGEFQGKSVLPTLREIITAPYTKAIKQTAKIINQIQHDIVLLQLKYTCIGRFSVQTEICKIQAKTNFTEE